MSNDKVAMNATVVSANPALQRNGAAQRNTATSASEVESALPKAKTESEPSTESAPKIVAADVAAVATRIEKYLKSINRSLEFKVDDASGRTVVTVRDGETGELIRQFPNEEVLRFAQLAEEQTVVLLSEKV